MRLANFETLRLCSMFFVLIVHSAFFSFGFPSPETIRANTCDFTILAFAEAAAYVCVDVFILISGWFGISSSFKSFCSLSFQILFYSLGTYFLMILGGFADFSLGGVANCLIPRGGGYWFVVAYLILYVFSPVLNQFIDHCDKKTITLVLAGAFITQTIYGWSGVVVYYNGGYSPLTFMFLYLLARYLRIYHIRGIKHSWKFYFGIYFTIVFLITTLTIGLAFISELDWFSLRLTNKLYSYINPLIVIEACALLLLFSKISISTRWTRIVNKCASSCFAVYLIHTHFSFLPHFQQIIRHCSNNSEGIVTAAKILVFLLIFYMLAMLVDQLRQFLWKQIWAKLEKLLHI